MLVIGTNELALIDTYRPSSGRGGLVSPTVTQADNPDRDLMTVGGTNLPELPQADVGGVNGSRDRNGYSTGFWGIRSKRQGFTGAIAKPPTIQASQAVQGQVGTNNKAGKLYAGVKNQLFQYVPNQASYAATYVGPVAATNITTSGS